MFSHMYVMLMLVYSLVYSPGMEMVTSAVSFIKFQL